MIERYVLIFIVALSIGYGVGLWDSYRISEYYSSCLNLNGKLSKSTIFEGGYRCDLPVTHYQNGSH